MYFAGKLVYLIVLPSNQLAISSPIFDTYNPDISGPLSRVFFPMSDLEICFTHVV